MSDIAIRVENLSKQYHIGRARQRHDTLRDALAGLFSRKRGGDDETFWALRDVSFDVKRGEVVGIIGRNGAGKSTLLKILSQITEPTGGRAEIHGRVGSLLEVGTGFHPELTGRENIYLNGAILGMRREEIARRFDEIVAFAEIEKFLDTPVKRYSSGMYVRLAFAVAAHLEPEILLVDEVLAVGDAAFQKKCLGKMGDVAQGGRTVFLVSHNMNVIQRLCNQVILLERGVITEQGAASNVVERYHAKTNNGSSPFDWLDLSEVERTGDGEARFVAIKIHGAGNDTERIITGGPLNVDLEIESDQVRQVSSIAVSIWDMNGMLLVNADTKSFGLLTQLKRGSNFFRFKIDQLYLTPGPYVIYLWMANYPGKVFDRISDVLTFEVMEKEVAKEFGVSARGLIPCTFQMLPFCEEDPAG